MKIEEIRKKVADTIEEIRADKESKWIREYYVIDIVFCTNPSRKLEEFLQWAENTGYWKKLRECAEEDADHYSIYDTDMMLFLRMVNVDHELTDEFENRYDEEMAL